LEAPFFSIITPTYNRERFLGPCIESVQAQSYRNYEHIIVDDGSVDGTEQLVQSYQKTDPRIIYIKQENQGRSTARNVGIDAAKGSYVCFLDSDDLWLDNHLQTLHNSTSGAVHPAFFHTGLIWFYDDGNPEQKVMYTDRKHFGSDVEYVIANEFAPDCVCVHRNAVSSNRFNANLFINEDIELWARIAAQFPVVSIPVFTAKLRVHAGNTDKATADSITPRKHAFRTIMQNNSVRGRLSKSFIRNRKRGLDELQVRYYESTGQQASLVIESLKFIVKYPDNPQNAAKLVTILYNLPGGRMLKSVIAALKKMPVE
jgi:glycosyltransferase involved in cell wall biosynthesis